MEDHFNLKSKAFSEKTVMQIGIQLIDKLEAMHKCGYLFNDLKPNNILVGNVDDEDLHSIKLIDFGISKTYLDENGDHVEEKSENLFKGNFIFASVNAFNFTTLSRRDDFISLCYLLIYMVDDGTSPFQVNMGLPRTPERKRLEFNTTKNLKLTVPLSELCASKKGNKMLAFMEIVFDMKFEDEPEYAKLRFMLTKILLDQNSVPNHEFDWNSYINTSFNRMPSNNSCESRNLELGSVDEIE